MIYNLTILIRSSMALLFGISVALLFAGVRTSRAARFVTALFFTLVLLTQILCWQVLGMQTTMRLYPFITHLPSVALLVFYYKRPWSISVSSVLTAYLCCQIPRWMGSVVGSVTGSSLADQLGYLITMCIVYYYLRRYIASSVTQLMERSTRSCLLFGAVPLLYYLFDYATTVYTDLLYSGAREAVQFTPSLICTFYLVFILLYYKESQKQSEAQRERDIIASQLHQAQIELDTMRQMQTNTVIYRHDMRHHLSLIGGFAADNDIQKIKDYLAITEADINALTPVRYCENETVNLILSSFAMRAKKENVILTTNLELPETLGVNDTELCSLLSNALENAITAAAQVTNEQLRKVYIQAIINHGKLVISTENAYVGNIEMDGELPKSKKNEVGHGYGIRSMIAIVERYGGLYSIETEGGMFTLQLLLPLEDAATSSTYT